jgi:hypothetical protein
MQVNARTADMAAVEIDPTRHGMSWMVGAFVVTFLLTRMITRLIRAGKGPFRNMTFGEHGVHVHHQVYGIFLMLISGASQFAYAPQGITRDVLAAVFGAGAALTLDEYALWFYMDDVYWSAEGRKSVDAVMIAAGIGILVLFGANPFDVGSGDSAPAAAVIIAINLGFAFAAIFKGKVATGLIGIFVPTVALVSTIRIAKPDSPWARWRYPEGSRKRAKALRRFPPGRRTWWDKFMDFVSGAPTRH